MTSKKSTSSIVRSKLQRILDRHLLIWLCYKSVCSFSIASYNFDETMDFGIRKKNFRPSKSKLWSFKKVFKMFIPLQCPLVIGSSSSSWWNPLTPLLWMPLAPFIFEAMFKGVDCLLATKALEGSEEISDGKTLKRERTSVEMREGAAVLSLL